MFSALFAIFLLFIHAKASQQQRPWTNVQADGQHSGRGYGLALMSHPQIQWRHNQVASSPVLSSNGEQIIFAQHGVGFGPSAGVAMDVLHHQVQWLDTCSEQMQSIVLTVHDGGGVVMGPCKKDHSEKSINHLFRIHHDGSKAWEVPVGNGTLQGLDAAVIFNDTITFLTTNKGNEVPRTGKVYEWKDGSELSNFSLVPAPDGPSTFSLSGVHSAELFVATVGGFQANSTVHAFHPLLQHQRWKVELPSDPTAMVGYCNRYFNGNCYISSPADGSGGAYLASFATAIAIAPGGTSVASFRLSYTDTFSAPKFWGWSAIWEGTPRVMYVIADNGILYALNHTWTSSKGELKQWWNATLCPGGFGKGTNVGAMLNGPIVVDGLVLVAIPCRTPVTLFALSLDGQPVWSLTSTESTPQPYSDIVLGAYSLAQGLDGTLFFADGTGLLALSMASSTGVVPPYVVTGEHAQHQVVYLQTTGVSGADAMLNRTVCIWNDILEVEALNGGGNDGVPCIWPGDNQEVEPQHVAVRWEYLDGHQHTVQPQPVKQVYVVDFSPSTGPVWGGTKVVFHGVGLDGCGYRYPNGSVHCVCQFGEHRVTGVLEGNSVTCTTPKSNVVGLVQVYVQAGTTSPAQGGVNFEFLPPSFWITPPGVAVELVVVIGIVVGGRIAWKRHKRSQVLASRILVPGAGWTLPSLNAEYVEIGSDEHRQLLNAEE